MAPATIRDVAKKAGVSVATVSRVLNNSSSVTQNTYQKVMTAIEELDFSPSMIARRLSTGRTHTIAVLTPFLTLPSSVERLRGVQAALAKTEYDLALFSAEAPDRVGYYMHDLARKNRADGLIIISLRTKDEQVERFQKAGVPVVLIDTSHGDLCSVNVDDVEGGYKATRHLLDLGHTRVAFLSDYLENPYKFIAMRQRYEGYRRAIEQAGLSFDPDYHQQTELGGSNAVAEARKLLTLPERPTAIFAASDTHAVGVLKAAHELHIQVPNELSVIGYDGIRDSEYLHITTMYQPLLDSGMIGVSSLLSMLETGADCSEQILLPTELVVRGTTVPPAS